MLAAATAHLPRPTLTKPYRRLAVTTVLALILSLIIATPVGAGAVGSVTVNKFDGETGEPLADACFVLVPEAGPGPIGPEQCTDETGTTVFELVPLGDYLLFETQPPPGYGFVEEPAPVSVTEAQPNPVVDIPNFPPPAFFEVHKFDCTGAEAASLHVFENPGWPPPGGFLDLDECAIGQATFLLTGGALPEPQPMETNIFGFAFTELEPGTYQLYETSPNQVGPVTFTIDPEEFVFVAAINPLDLPPGATGPQGPPGPPGPPGPAGPAGPAGQGGVAPTARPAAQLPDTSTAVPATGSWLPVWLVAATVVSGLAALHLGRRRRP